MSGRIRTGIAGWVFADWRNGAFYPEGLPQKQELAFASAALGVIEINGTFRSLQKPQSFLNWAGQTPDDFVFSVKGPQLVTHIKRLKEVEEPLANFFASGPLALGRKNYLFAGSHEAAKRAASIYSFFAMCKKEDVNPYEWLNYAFEKLSETKMTELHLLLPKHFKTICCADQPDTPSSNPS